MQMRIAQLVVRVAGLFGASVSTAYANEIAAVLIGVTALAVDLWLHRKQRQAEKPEQQE